MVRNRKDQNGRSLYAGQLAFDTSGNPRTSGNAFADALLKINKLGTKSEAGKPKAPVRILKVTIEQIDPNATTTTPSTPPSS